MGGREKPFMELQGVAVLEHALRPFLEFDQIVAVRIAVSEATAASPPDWLQSLGPRVRLVRGGKTRAESVRNALRALPDDLDVVVVHDAARPFVTLDLIRRCLLEAGKGHGAVAALPVVDTIKRVDGSGAVVETVPRTTLYRAQTPQAFPRALLVGAYERLDPDATPTDDSSIVELDGGRVVLVEGDPANLKVTTPHDLVLAAAHLCERER